MKQKAESAIKGWWQNRKKETRVERLYGWRMTLGLGVLLFIPHLVIGWADPAQRNILLSITMILIGGAMYLRWLVPYKPIKGVRLRRMKMQIHWQQVHRWFKQKHVREVWGDPKARLDEILQKQALGDEYIIQVEDNPDWHDVGYIRVEPGKPPMIVVGEKFAHHQGVAEKAKALLASEQGAAADKKIPAD